MFPESKQYSSEKMRAGGIARHGIQHEETVSPCFTEDTAKKSDLTQRQIRNYIRIAEALPEDVKETVKKIDLPISETSIL